MHRLERIIVRGFRGQSRPIELNLKPDANFLIGRNGTGKTTLINLIHAALSMDLPALRESAFDRLEFVFKKPKSRIKPRFSVTRTLADDGHPNICYRIADNATQQPDEYHFTRQKRRAGALIIRTVEGTETTISKRPLRDRLSSIYQTTWLSLQRGADKLAPENEWDEDHRPDVDRKLDNLSNNLTRYFSRLDRKVSDQTQLFQKTWFLSFLANDRRVRERDIDRLDEDKEREALSSIFEDFDMRYDEYNAQLDRHFRLSRRAKSSLKDGGSSVPVKDYLVAVDVMRMHMLVEQWQELERVKELIYGPRFNFERVASEMLFRKTLFTNTSNQIVIQSELEEPIPLDKLSSGEKQLLIFLSETLLQEQESYIFMADEPELSMHVEWQEELVPALLGINPAAQVLFATHSPDVVNKYQQNVFRMEDLVD